jgi:hypothetical protein
LASVFDESDLPASSKLRLGRFPGHESYFRTAMTQILDLSAAKKAFTVVAARVIFFAEK